MELELETIWAGFKTELLRYIRSKVRDFYASEDILQEVFVKIHKSLDTFRNRQRLKPWLFAITQNAIIDYYRKRKEEAAQIEEAMSLAESDEGDDGVKESVLGCLQALMNRLPETYREPLRLFEFEGLKHQEIARKLDISISNSKVRVQRGREKLKLMMSGYCDFEFDPLGKIIDYTVRDGKSGCGDILWLNEAENDFPHKPV